MKELNTFRQFLNENEQYDKTKVATNPNDVKIIARTRAYYSYDYLVDPTEKEEIIGKVTPQLEKLSPNTLEEQWEMFINTVKYHNSNEAKAELEKVKRAYDNNPLVYFRSEFQDAKNYYSGY